LLSRHPPPGRALRALPARPERLHLRAGLPARRARVPASAPDASRRARQALLRRGRGVPRGDGRDLRPPAHRAQPGGLPRHARGMRPPLVGRGAGRGRDRLGARAPGARARWPPAGRPRGPCGPAPPDQRGAGARGGRAGPRHGAAGRDLRGGGPHPRAAAVKMSAPRRYSVVVAKDYLKFAAAHFIAYPGFREPLHGHNYQVSVRVEADLGPDGYVLDFGLVKRVAKALCEELDERGLGCHRLYAPGSMTLAMWKVQTGRMREEFARRGMPWLTPDEERALLDYLAAHAGRS